MTAVGIEAVDDDDYTASLAARAAISSETPGDLAIDVAPDFHPCRSRDAKFRMTIVQKIPSGNGQFERAALIF